MNIGRIKWGLTCAIAAFVVLDFAMFAISYSIAKQVNQYTVLVNLAGRQRMLSQRITKAALLAVDAKRSETQRRASAMEAQSAYTLLRDTLSAFTNGGEAVGGDGRMVLLQPVDEAAAVFVRVVQGKFSNWPVVPQPGAGLPAFALFMVDTNNEILDAMNQMTTTMEQSSEDKILNLRIAQTATFILSLLNFFGILWWMYREKQRAEVRSQTDELTGLYNRAGLYRKLADVFAVKHTTEPMLGVVLLDLDGFKAVNDTCGHAAGDETLREVARRLSSWCPPGWTCARLGGDEFAVICPGLDSTALERAAAKLSDILSAIPGGSCMVSASVGWASASPDSTADALMAAADLKMYAMKAKTRYTTEYRGAIRSL